MRSERQDGENAAACRRFTERFSMYAETSHWLVERARLHKTIRIAR
ncbi:MAG: hypothetical protein ACR2F6_01355 [Mycobacteriales bacterium]